MDSSPIRIQTNPDFGHKKSQKPQNQINIWRGSTNGMAFQSTGVARNVCWPSEYPQLAGCFGRFANLAIERSCAPDNTSIAVIAPTSAMAMSVCVSHA